MTTDDKITALVLLNCLKSPMQRLTSVGSENMDIYNSMKRVSEGTKVEESTNGEVSQT